MFDHPRCPYYIIANIPLCDFSIENGATEFWLGSHAATTLEDQQPVTDATRATWKPKHPSDRIPWISEGPKEARRAVRPPVQPEVVRGDIMIRDLRTWHAGMPNCSDKHRIMLGLGYQVGNSLSLVVKWLAVLLMSYLLEPFPSELQAAHASSRVTAGVLHGSCARQSRGQS